MKTQKGVFLILIILTLVIFVIYNDYTWSTRVTKIYRDKGWDIEASVSSNAAYLYAPWTLFKRPIYRIALLRSDKINKIGGKYLITDTLWLNHEPLYNTTAEYFRDVYDCDLNKTAYIDQAVNLNMLDFSQLQWDTYSDGPGYEILKKVCEYR